MIKQMLIDKLINGEITKAQFVDLAMELGVLKDAPSAIKVKKIDAETFNKLSEKGTVVILGGK